MTTTGSTAFNLDMNDLIEESFERCGLEVRSGYDFRTARRSLNLLTIEWANRGINLWTVEQGQIVMNTQQALYALPVDTIDILDAPQLNLLIKDLKEGLSIIEDDQKTANFTGKDYILVKNNINLDNKLLLFYNKEYNISKSINKSSVVELINWLEAIKF